MELILIRHGLPETIENAVDRAADPDLSATGQLQARRLRDYLSSWGINAIYTSPMKRAFQTAAPTAEQLSITAQVEPGIIEFDAHSHSYIPSETLKKTNYKQWQGYLNGRYGDDVDFEKFGLSVRKSLEKIIANHPGEKVAVFCHGGVINVWASYVIGIPTKMFFVPEYTSMNRFLAAATGQKTLVSLNETTHLAQFPVEQYRSEQTKASFT